ncbi:MAG: hypothetical protein ACTSWG_10260 [Candidatus Helarchaeota archaeon]
MKIILDNEYEDFHRLISIKNNTEDIYDVLEIIFSALQFYGFHKNCIDNAIIEMANNLIEEENND